MSDREFNIPTSLEVDGLTHLWTKSARFLKDKMAKVRIGPLTVVYLCSLSEAEASVSKAIDNATLTLTVTFSGKIPASPFTYLSLGPEEIGHTGGFSIYLAHEVGITGKDNLWVDLTISLYCKATEAQTQNTPPPPPTPAATPTNTPPEVSK